MADEGIAGMGYMDVPVEVRASPPLRNFCMLKLGLAGMDGAGRLADYPLVNFAHCGLYETAINKHTPEGERNEVRVSFTKCSRDGTWKPWRDTGRSNRMELFRFHMH